MICPTCNSKKVHAGVDSYGCDRCKTTFDIDGKIITEGITPKCPLNTCGSPLIQVRKRGSYIICRKCGTTFFF